MKRINFKSLKRFIVIVFLLNFTISITFFIFFIVYLLSFSLPDRANLIHEALDTLLADRVHPVSILLEVGPHDEGVGGEEVVVEVLRSAARPDEDGDVDGLLDGADLALISGAPRGLTRDNHAVTKEVLSGMSGLNNINIGSNSMRTVLLLDVSELKKIHINHIKYSINTQNLRKILKEYLEIYKNIQKIYKKYRKIHKIYGKVLKEYSKKHRKYIENV